MLTVREVLADVDIALLAGEGHIDMPVRWVHISELADPTPWLSGGELLLTTGIALNSPKRQREYIATLADHGLAGLGLGTGFTHEKVPKALLEAARERDFPLFEVPYELPFIALTEHAFTRLVNEQYALLQRSIAAQERLQRIVLSERGLDAIVGALAALIGGPALVFDGRGELQAARTFRRELDPELVAAVGDELRERARRGDGRGLRTRAPRAGHARSGAARRRQRPARARAAAGVARCRQGRRRPGRDRSPDPAPGGDRRRPRAAAPPGGRLDRAQAGRRRAVGGHRGRARGRRARRAGSGPSASAAA